MNRFVLFAIAIGVWISSVAGQTTNNDPIGPLITFLEQLQKLRELYTTARQSSNYLAPIAPTVSSQAQPISVLSFLQQSATNSPLSSIADATDNTKNNNNSGASFTIQLPSSFGRSNRPNTDIQRINQGLTEILEGVRTASLERILRGSFSFTRNNNVRSVADTVLTSLFTRPNRGRNQNSINAIN